MSPLYNNKGGKMKTLILLLFSISIFAQSGQWVYFDKGNSPIPSNQVLAVAENQQSEYYISTSLPPSFFSYSPISGWTRIDTAGSIFEGETISYLYKDQFDRLWALGSNIYYLSENTWEKIETTIVPSAITVEESNLIWFGTYYSGFYKYDFNHITKVESDLLNYEINVITIDKKNNKWIGMDDGGELVKMNDSSIVKISHPDFLNFPINTEIPPYSVNGLIIDNEGALWISAHSISPNWELRKYNFANYNPLDSSWILYDSSDVGMLINTHKRVMQIDNNNSLWVGTSEGLMQYDGIEFSFYSSDNSGLPEDNVWNILIDTYGNKWLSGYPNYGIAVFNETGVVNITDVENEEFKVKNYHLLQNYPNPFNPSTTISYSLPKSGFVKLDIYDVLGSKVVNLVNEERAIGKHKIDFDASHLTSGIYFYRLHRKFLQKIAKYLLIVQCFRVFY